MLTFRSNCLDLLCIAQYLRVGFQYLILQQKQQANEIFQLARWARWWQIFTNTFIIATEIACFVSFMCPVKKRA